jgi:heme A synthase
MKVLELAITAVCLLSALWLVVLLVRDRTPERWFLNAMAGVEVLLLVHLVVGIVKVTGAPARVSVWEYVGYLIGIIVIVPLGVMWSSDEKSRGGTGVLLIALLVVPFLFVRLSDIWAGGA